jgi:hypothetical protein
MVELFFRFGQRYNDKGRALGAQTKRRGIPRPVSVLLGGGDSPAAFFSCSGFKLLRVNLLFWAGLSLASSASHPIDQRRRNNNARCSNPASPYI